MGIPGSGTLASTFTPFGSGTIGELTAAAGNMFTGPTCDTAGRVSRAQMKRAANLHRSPKTANNLFFKNHLLEVRRSGGRNAD